MTAEQALDILLNDNIPSDSDDENLTDNEDEDIDYEQHEEDDDEDTEEEAPTDREDNDDTNMAPDQQQQKKKNGWVFFSTGECVKGSTGVVHIPELACLPHPQHNEFPAVRLRHDMKKRRFRYLLGVNSISSPLSRINEFSAVV